MDLVILLTPEMADAMQHGGGAELRTALARLGGDLRPQHPGILDRELGRYFVISAVPAGRAEDVIAELLKLEGIEAAYVQPAPGPP